MILSLYRAAAVAAGPAIRLYLSLRRSQGKEDPVRFRERFGQPGQARPEGSLVWIHAASVGESLSMLPLIGRIRKDKPDWRILLTTGTVTSAAMMAERLPEGAIHQYIPVDRPGYVQKFLDHWQPELTLWAESEFWPNLISEISARRIPLVLVNGRISPSSFTGWRRFPGLIARLLSGFTLCLGQTEGDAERLSQLGAKNAQCAGNIKFAAPPLPADEGDLTAWIQGLANRPRWLAASTHAGEEAIAGDIHRTLAPDHPDLLTIIVPRHPGRGPAIKRELEASGLSCALRSINEPVVDGTDIYIADTMGELGLFFRLAEVIFMGKSLVPLGGHMGGQNPLEPARLGCALLFGPNMANFAEMSARMVESGAALEVADGDALGKAVDRLLKDAGERNKMAVAVQSFAEAEAEVLDQVMDVLTPYFEQAAMKHTNRKKPQ